MRDPTLKWGINKNWVNCKKAKYIIIIYMLICSEVYQMKKKVGINVQRLDSEDFLPIIYPRAPNSFWF